MAAVSPQDKKLVFVGYTNWYYRERPAGSSSQTLQKQLF
jgi:hypothetical protein